MFWTYRAGEPIAQQFKGKRGKSLSLRRYFPTEIPITIDHVKCYASLVASQGACVKCKFMKLSVTVKPPGALVTFAVDRLFVVKIQIFVVDIFLLHLWAKCFTLVVVFT